MIASGVICLIYIICAVVLFFGVREQKGECLSESTILLSLGPLTDSFKILSKAKIIDVRFPMGRTYTLPSCDYSSMIMGWGSTQSLLTLKALWPRNKMLDYFRVRLKGSCTGKVSFKVKKLRNGTSERFKVNSASWFTPSCFFSFQTLLVPGLSPCPSFRGLSWWWGMDHMPNWSWASFLPH